MTPATSPRKKVISKGKNKPKNNTLRHGEPPKNHTFCKIVPVIQLKLTPERKKLWKTWQKYSMFEKSSEVLVEALETACKFKEILQRQSIHT